ncbi:hypothetical protein [Edwardsiella ictaluri]|uniref:hypothetical protein n=1 Tax=Edwardsiella ictaluri TaxID=67780 RepID=UPI00155924C2|nr:hypothetical protein [Edwardsiella ictaluri]WFO13511.1 hypothetical protein MAY82_04365 [Edwardsiella ictaluri]
MDGRTEQRDGDDHEKLDPLVYPLTVVQSESQIDPRQREQKSQEQASEGGAMASAIARCTGMQDTAVKYGQQRDGSAQV